MNGKAKSKQGKQMIHYHGTPIGGSRQDAARFLVGRHAMVSFYRPDDLPIVTEVCQSFALDNGAFSHWKSGKGDIDYDSYKEWVVGFMFHPGFDFAIIPDKIDGTEEENTALIHRWLDDGLGQWGAPVWHMHESLDMLQQLCGAWRIVCIGSSGQWSYPGSKKWWERINEAMKAACSRDGKPLCKLHGLRMMDPRIFTKLPFSSADSTNAAVNQGSANGFGIYRPATAAQRSAVIADRVEMYSSSPIYTNVGTQDELFLEI